MESNPSKRISASVALNHRYFYPLKTKSIKFDIPKHFFAPAQSLKDEVKSSMLVDPSKNGIAIYLHDENSQQVKPEVSRNIDTATSISGGFSSILSDGQSAFSAGRISLMSGTDSNCSSGAKVGTLPNVYKSLRTSIFKNMKHGEGYENAGSIEISPITEVERYSAYTTSDFFRQKSSLAGFEESEDLEDDDDEKSNLGLYMRRIKEQEILKPEARMSRFF